VKAARPWIDHPSCAAWLGQGAFGDHSGRALGLHQHGYCLFRPRDPEWLSLIETAHREASAGSSSVVLKKLAIHSELVDVLKTCFGRQPYSSQFLVSQDGPQSEPSTIADQFQTEPDGFLCGAWIALEEIITDAEAFCLYPRSHRNPPLMHEHQLLSHQQLQENGFDSRLIKARRGDVLITHSRLHHVCPGSLSDKSSLWLPMLTFLFAGCRLIDLASSRGVDKHVYRKSIDLNTGRLRPNWHDHYLMRRKSLVSPKLPARKMSFDFTGQALIDHDEFELKRSRGDFGSCDDLAQQINQKGFGLLKIVDPHWEDLLDQVRAQLEPHVDLKKLAAGTLEPTRFQDAWKHLNVEAVRQVACHPEILASLRVLYGRVSFPFQTLNFPNGTAQHFHSDAVHFHSLPHGFMCGAWVALEDISADSGPLVYFPGSHRMPYLAARDFGLTQAEVLAEPAPQKFFEPHWRDCVAADGYQRCLFEARKGDVLVWHANLLHGGSPVKKKSLSRWSQVTHYFFEGCAHMTPLFQTMDASTDGPQWRVPIPIQAADVLTNS